jgi:hypothetical protein
VELRSVLGETRPAVGTFMDEEERSVKMKRKGYKKVRQKEI